MTSPFTDTPLDLPAAEQLAATLHALADPARLQILNMLHRADGELTMAELVAGIGRLKQPAVSYHVRMLTRAWFVYHRLTPAGIAAVAAAIHPDGER